MKGRCASRATAATMHSMAFSAKASSSSSSFSTSHVIGTTSMSKPYKPPKWAENVLRNVPPHGRLTLANLPTPLYRVVPTSIGNNQFNNDCESESILQRLDERNITLFIKRDDMTGGVELGGNKIRKLEFLLADALADQECNCVVTIGGEQSNHCRATASACRMVGLEPHLILRTERANKVYDGALEEFGYTGNILFDRMAGSVIYTCTPGEYGRVGSHALVDRVCQYLTSQSNVKRTYKPYPIPVGGSNGIGSWGYINAVDELMGQLEPSEGDNRDRVELHHVVFACGSGGTAAGITLGIALAHGALVKDSSSQSKSGRSLPIVHAVGVCDDPDYFYRTVSEIADEMGFSLPKSSSFASTEEFVRNHLMAHQGKGLGYASSTPEELDFITQFALETGIVLDPVYSGKALYHFITRVLEENPEAYQGKNILFWHTGGALGMYDKGQDLLGMLSGVSPVRRLDVYGKKGEGMVSI